MNEKLRVIEEKIRSEEFNATENTFHTTLLLQVIEECDNRLFDSDDADITIQDVFVESDLCEDGEMLQDVLSDRIYSYLQDIREAF